MLCIGLQIKADESVSIPEILRQLAATMECPADSELPAEMAGAGDGFNFKAVVS